MEVRVTFLHKKAHRTGRAADRDTLKEVDQNALLCLFLHLCVCVCRQCLSVHVCASVQLSMQVRRNE